MKSVAKLLLPLLFLTTIISASLYTTGCKDNDLTSGDTITVANPDVKVYRDLVISEFFDGTSRSSINLNDGQIVLANDAIRDAELSDSSAFGPSRFYIRSGDGNQDHFAPGQETKFLPFFNTKSSSYSQVNFDTNTVIYPGHSGALVASDFYKYSTYSLGTSFTSNDVRVYAFWLKGKKVNYGLPYEVYGLMYLKAINTVIVGGVSTYQLTVDVKVNQKGQNDFRERIPSTVN